MKKEDAMNETGFDHKIIGEMIAAANATAVSHLAETEGETALLGLNPIPNGSGQLH